MVILTLTIGIGINASVFTVLNGTALKPQVQGDPASFVRIFAQSQQDSRLRPVSYSEYKRSASRTVRCASSRRFVPLPC